MPKGNSQLSLRTRSTGMLITTYWSRTGADWRERRIRWGQFAVRKGGTKLGGDSDGFGLWELPKGVTLKEVNEWCEENLKVADRMVAVLPHGDINGASAISIHTHNIRA